ncbi:MAG: hypothetical protein B7X41_13075, partial [Microbacterium sp. 14-71-5]
MAVADRLDELLPADAYLAASEQVDTSFFTPSLIVDAVFDLLRATGFTGGRVLEPGCGNGAFMQAAPADLDIAWTGVEVDPTASRMCRLLNPDAVIHEGKLQSTALAEDFDAVVGNVPFSHVRLWDGDARGDVLHNYFIRRSVAAVRPGGYVILVTSRHTMDSRTGL